MKLRASFNENINKIDRHLVKLAKTRKEKIQINKLIDWQGALQQAPQKMVREQNTQDIKTNN